MRPLLGLDVWRGREGVDGRMRGHDGVVGFGAGWRGLEGMTGLVGPGLFALDEQEEADDADADEDCLAEF
jgi:hypothetical protein